MMWMDDGLMDDDVMLLATHDGNAGGVKVPS